MKENHFFSSRSQNFFFYFKSPQKPGEDLAPLYKIFKKASSVFDDFLLEEVKLYQKGASYIELSLSLCGKFKIQKLNQKYRGKNRVTDVLSFSLHEDLRRLKSWEGGLLLGDIFICREVARKQASNLRRTYSEEVILLFIHGFLHLLGYDHEKSGQEEQIMAHWEGELAKKIFGA